MRIVLGVEFEGGFADLFSFTFVWILPIVTGLTPLLFLPKEDLNSLNVRFLRPLSAVLAFFILYYWTGH
jgi:hypothetical protein